MVYLKYSRIRKGREMDYYSDASLQADIDAYDGGLSVGPYRRAQILLAVPHEARKDIAWDAMRMSNMTGARMSDALRSSVHAWRNGRL